MKNLNANLKIYQKYNKVVENGIQKWLNFDQIYLLLKWEKADTLQTNNIKNGLSKEEREDVQIKSREKKDLEKKIQWEQNRELLDKKKNEIKKFCESQNPWYHLRIIWSWATFDLVVSPENDYKKQYILKLEYRNNYRRLSSWWEDIIMLINNSSYGIDKLISIVMSVIIKSANYSYDNDTEDIKKWLFEYDWDVIEFNVNNRPRDPNVANKDDFKQLLELFPDKKDVIMNKIANILSEVYRVKIAWKHY